MASPPERPAGARPRATPRATSGAARKRPAASTAPAAAAPPSPPTWPAWRIADGRYEPYSAVGASLVGGRWNSPGLGVIYASRSYAGAMLECLAQAGIGRVPRTQVAIEIAIPESVSVERLDEGVLPRGWDQADLRVARALGDAWLRSRRTAVLVVRSVVARKEFNVLINPAQPDFHTIVPAAPEPVIWDQRLFGGR